MTDEKQPVETTAQDAQIAEATQEDLAVTFDGEVWTINPAMFVDLTYLSTIHKAMTRPGGNAYMVGAVEMLLGPDQAARFFAGRDLAAVSGFYAAIDETAGAGNS